LPFSRKRDVSEWENKSFSDGKLFADLGAREIRKNRFLSCNPLAEKAFSALFTEKIIL